MGFEPKALSQGYLIVIKRDTWTLNIQIRLSEDKRKVGINANLGDVKEPQISGAQWMALLAATGDVEPSMFYYDPKQKRLYLHRVLDNRNMTNAILRDELEKFSTNVVTTENIWSPVTQ